ncbi:MAG: YicC family protein [Lentisphaerae bacterium]|nr:YicC family protein [Lentisphaerota bacterium]OQC13581.1 MAG: hypothetical protein BWX73_02251 [Lentisphaerae bacterium ADurb.Bin082]HQL87935.1 YicC family protein [Lentisphaeria bacterium]
MKSMTGYGRATAEANGNQVTVEVSAVNSRKLVDMRFTMPRELNALEPMLRQSIQQHFSRGSLNIVVSYKLSEENRRLQAAIDLPAAQAAAKMLTELAQQTGLQPPTVQDIIAFPGVISENVSSSLEPLKELVVQALEAALADLSAMREKEGAALREDLLARGKTIAALVEQIAARGDDALVLQRQRLRDRIAALGVELTLDDERLTKELTFYAERADITEEIVRLQSHLVQYEELLNSDDAPGRNLDFLSQEMSREANTLSAKTADLAITNDVLVIKAELGRIREQIMNIE